MRLIAAPGVGLAPLRGRLNFPGHSLTLIAKAKLALLPGEVARLLSDAPAFATGDEPYPDDPLAQGSPRYASDFAFEKPNAELMVVGHFHAPQKKLVRASEVAVSLADRSTRLAVIGRRRYFGQGPLPTAKEAEPFHRLALRWEHAFGGLGHTHNPIGTGYAGETHARDFAREPLELPRIERPDRLFTELDQRLEPVCFAPRSASWPVRRDLAGTCDAQWLRTRWPWLPQDFDARHFMASLPALQQRGYLRGDERLCFTNMHPELARYETQLPGLTAIGVVQRLSAQGSGKVDTEHVPLALDTLWVDMDAQVAQLIWRGSLVCSDREASDIRHAWVGLASCELALTPAEICARGAEAIAEEEAQWNIVADPLPAAQEEQVEAERRPVSWTRELVASASTTPGALRGVDLSGLDLSELDLAGVDLSGALLCSTRFSRTNLRGAYAAGARLVGAVFRDCQLDEADFAGAELERAEFHQCTLGAVRFTGARLAHTNFLACALPEADFERAHLPSASFRQCNLDDVLLEGANAVGLRLEASSVARLRAADADMSAARWHKASGADLIAEGAKLGDAELRACQLPGLDLSGGQLPRARITGSLLKGAKFARADLSDACLLGNDCFEASFEAARLVGCDGSGTSFFRAEFLDADVRNFHGRERDLTGSKLASAKERGAA